MLAAGGGFCPACVGGTESAIVKAQGLSILGLVRVPFYAGSAVNDAARAVLLMAVFIPLRWYL